MVIKMHTKFRRMYEQSGNFNKETGNIRKYQMEVTELKNTATRLKKLYQRGSIPDYIKYEKGSVNLKKDSDAHPTKFLDIFSNMSLWERSIKAKINK